MPVPIDALLTRTRGPALLGLLLLGCGKDQDSAPFKVQKAAASPNIDEYTAPYWNVRIGAVRSELKRVSAALADGDRKEARLAWLQAYRGIFEPQVETEARGRLDDHELVEIEYAFGKLGFAITYLDDKDTTAALVDVETRLKALPDRLSINIPTSAPTAAPTPDGEAPVPAIDDPTPRPRSTTDVPVSAPRLNGR